MGLVIKNKMFSLDCKYMKTIQYEDTIKDDHICVINNFNDYGCYHCKSFEKVEKMTEKEQMTECVFTCNKSKEERLDDIKERINELREEKKKLEYEVMKENSVSPVYLVYDSHIYSERYEPLLFKTSQLAIEYIKRTGNPNLDWREVGICFELFDEEVKE